MIFKNCNLFAFICFFHIFSSKYSKKLQLRHRFLFFCCCCCRSCPLHKEKKNGFYLRMLCILQQKKKKRRMEQGPSSPQGVKKVCYLFFFDIMNCSCLDHSLSPSSKEKKKYNIHSKKIRVEASPAFEKNKNGLNFYFFILFYYQMFFKKIGKLDCNSSTVQYALFCFFKKFFFFDLFIGVQRAKQRLEVFLRKLKEKIKMKIKKSLEKLNEKVEKNEIEKKRKCLKEKIKK
ncbi:hypothetical protein RFI_35791 [Reticulomyxa filosa]|uniref:Uncharacterized protein n=1 Tax=Reticulomyxa filosa TaxID=46433 RepID=X6LJ48_RETFI|nr:hypothetical protein RFI_35791 [Reticulomyxa filosa]|eukprot:ETO01649.1 hypothetical protein RFI_35791 [Reticulomyxa filosa]